MKTQAIISALFIVACARSGTSADDANLRAQEVGPAKVDGSYELYFSNPLPDLITRLSTSSSSSKPSAEALARWAELKDTQVASGGDFASALTGLMATASGEGCALLVADYDFDVTAVAQGMVDAKVRGCDVRFVTDGTILARGTAGSPTFNQEHFDAFEILRKGGIAIHNDGQRGPIMHNKFAVVRGDRGNALWTGSWNMTVDDQVSYWNNGIAFHSDEAVDVYTKYFENLYERLQEDGKVGPRKPLALSDEDRTFTAGGVPFEVYFPSTDKAMTRLVSLINGAEKSIQMLAFSFTSEDMTNAMVARIKAGVTMHGIVENTGACSGGFKTLVELPEAERANVHMYRWRYGPKNFLHHKVMIIDEKIVVFGSFNFSKGAEGSNDENLLIAQDADFAAKFVETYNLIEEVTALSPQEEGCSN